MSETATEPRRSGDHGRLPLSLNTTRRLLAQLLTRAEEGDVAASEALIRLGWQSRLQATYRSE